MAFPVFADNQQYLIHSQSIDSAGGTQVGGGGRLPVI